MIGHISHNVEVVLAQNLSTLKRLKILSAQSNRITKIEGIENLEYLEDVYLSHNGIERLEGFDRNVSYFLYYVEPELIDIPSS